MQAQIICFRKALHQIVVAVINGLIHRQLYSDLLSYLGRFLVLGIIPEVVAGVLSKGMVEYAFGSPRMPVLFLLSTALLSVIAERVVKRTHQLDTVSRKEDLIIGQFQVISFSPAISRSRYTIQAE
jgi:undecaprenyl pyrophosphate phosphatase UppP